MIHVTEEGPDFLDAYATIPIAFEVAAPVPYVKDYDAYAGQRPPDWRRFDLSAWGFFAARIEGELVGAAAVARATPGLALLDAAPDAALLFDIRVAPQHRGKGVGAALFMNAERWAASRLVKLLVIETQDINAGACRFYEAMGCTLAASNPNAYPDLPNEVQLLWHKTLAAGS